MESTKLIEKQSNKLILLGMLLFFLALITGVIAPLLGNPRLGISSHVEGVLNGIFLIVLGLIWNKVTLSERWMGITFWLSIYGTFANWLGYFISAVFNAGRHLTIATNGHAGPPWADNIVDFLLLSLTVSMLTICITVIIGLNRNMKDKSS